MSQAQAPLREASSIHTLSLLHVREAVGTTEGPEGRAVGLAEDSQGLNKQAVTSACLHVGGVARQNVLVGAKLSSSILCDFTPRAPASEPRRRRTATWVLRSPSPRPPCVPKDQMSCKGTASDTMWEK